MAKFEGASVGDFNGKTVKQCKLLCDLNKRCNSFAFGGGSWCHLKDKCIQASEPQKVNGYHTYYKDCKGKSLIPAF